MFGSEFIFLNYDLDSPDTDYDKAFKTLADSLKHKTPIYVIGKACFDYNTVLKKISITKVESESKLL